MKTIIGHLLQRRQLRWSPLNLTQNANENMPSTCNSHFKLSVMQQKVEVHIQQFITS